MSSTIVANASHSAMCDAITTLKTKAFPSNSWSPARATHGQTCPPTPERVAAFAFLHMWDGWNYLGKALDAAYKNDYGIAGHLAYYAELRASLSLLSANGIHIENMKNYIIDKQGTPQTLSNEPTHKATWNVLNNFAVSNNTDKTNIGQIIKPYKIHLEDWISAFTGNAVGGKHIYRRYLIDWGVDLKATKHDREARNTYSYQPTTLNSLTPQSLNQVKETILEFWDLFEPKAFGTFQGIDIYLLRMTLLKTKKELSLNRSQYKTAISNMLNSLPLAPTNRIEIESFIFDEKSHPTPQLLKRFTMNPLSITSETHLCIIARAFLLLRIATGACSKILETSNVNRNTLNFWWDKLGTVQGLWEIDEPSPLEDLWSDIDTAIEDIKTQTHTNYKDLGSLSSNAFFTLSGTCRIALWGLAL